MSTRTLFPSRRPSALAPARLAGWLAAGLLATGLLLLPASASAQTNWGTNVTAFKGQVGKTMTFLCPAGGAAGSLYGTDIYTTDSSVCTAGVHAGVINLAAGGAVTIIIQPGLASYTSTARNGVTSTSWGAYGGSFTVVQATTWSTAAQVLAGNIGKRFAFVCPAGGSLGSAVYGTGLYTTDSSVCAAAVHAGRIGAARGGRVTIEIRPGAGAYAATASNGVASRSWGAYQSSYLFR
jgi:hypothetical protein